MADSQKKNSRDDKTKKSQEHSISVDNLRTCLDCYRELRSRGAAYLPEIAERLGLDKATLHRRLHRFEELIQEKGRDDFRLIVRGQGKKASPNEEPEIEQIVGDLAQIVEAWDRVISDWGVRRSIVRMGMSLTASRYFISLLSREFPKVGFDTTHSRPRRLLDLAQRKKWCDLVLTAIPSDEEPIHDFDANREGTYRWNRDMNMKVIAPRGHFTELEGWTIDNPDQRLRLWERMAKEGQTLCILREEPDRYPMTHLPTRELPPQLRVHRVGSSQMLEAMVLSSDPDHQHVMIGLPHFLSNDDRERLHILDAKLHSTRMGLIRPNKDGEQKPENAFRTEIIDRLEERMINELNALIDKEEEIVTQHKHYYHLTRINDRHVWVEGDVWWRIRTTVDTAAKGERMVSGRYRIEVNGETHHYLIRGRVLIKKNGQCHLVCRMTSMGEAFIDEFSVSSIFANEKELLQAEICGIWMGTTAWNRDSARVHEDCRGCVVIASSEQNHAQLEEIARKYKEMQNIAEPIFTGEILL